MTVESREEPRPVTPPAPDFGPRACLAAPAPRPVWWTVVILGLLVLDWCLGWDAAVWSWCRAHQPSSDLARPVMACEVYGQCFGLVVAVLLMVRLHPPRRGAAAAVLITVTAVGLTASTLKVAVGRVRPNPARGRTRIEGYRAGLASDRKQSFPSGHTAAAFALSGCLESLYPPARPIWVALAVGCGLSRVWGNQHFLSDVLVGAWLGAWLSRWIFLSSPLRRLAGGPAPIEDRG